jgi:hypothetical protein
MPPLRLHCVGRILVSNPGLLRHRHWLSDSLTTWLHLIHIRLNLIHNSATSHPQFDYISSTLDYISSTLDYILSTTRLQFGYISSATSHPHSATYHPYSATSHPQFDHISSTLGYILYTTRLHLIHSHITSCTGR